MSRHRHACGVAKFEKRAAVERLTWVLEHVINFSRFKAASYFLDKQCM